MKPMQWRRDLEKRKYKEENMEDDDKVKMWRYEIGMRSKIQVRDNQGEMRWVRIDVDDYKGRVQSKGRYGDDRNYL